MTTPSRMTITRLHTPRISGNSLEMKTTAMSFAGKLLNYRVNLRFGADIDASGGLVENKHLGIDLEPTRQEELLLIAAGKSTGPNPKRSRAQTKSLRLRPGTLINVTEIDNPALGVSAQNVHGNVVPA